MPADRRLHFPFCRITPAVTERMFAPQGARQGRPAHLGYLVEQHVMHEFRPLILFVILLWLPVFLIGVANLI